MTDEALALVEEYRRDPHHPRWRQLEARSVFPYLLALADEVWHQRLVFD